MIKKDYQKPTMNVVLLQHRTMLLSGSITDVNSGDTGIGYDGPGSGPARARLGRLGVNSHTHTGQCGFDSRTGHNEENNFR